MLEADDPEIKVGRYRRCGRRRRLRRVRSGIRLDAESALGDDIDVSAFVDRRIEFEVISHIGTQAAVAVDRASIGASMEAWQMAIGVVSLLARSLAARGIVDAAWSARLPGPPGAQPIMRGAGIGVEFDGDVIGGFANQAPGHRLSAGRGCLPADDREPDLGTDLLRAVMRRGSKRRARTATAIALNRDGILHAFKEFADVRDRITCHCTVVNVDMFLFTQRAVGHGDEVGAGMDMADCKLILSD